MFSSNGTACPYIINNLFVLCQSHGCKCKARLVTPFPMRLWTSPFRKPAWKPNIASPKLPLPLFSFHHHMMSSKTGFCFSSEHLNAACYTVIYVHYVMISRVTQIFCSIVLAYMMYKTDHLYVQVSLRQKVLYDFKEQNHTKSHLECRWILKSSHIIFCCQQHL